MLQPSKCSRAVDRQQQKQCKPQTSSRLRRQQASSHALRLRYLHDSMARSLVHARAAAQGDSSAVAPQQQQEQFRQAHEEGSLGFGFSAGGLLFPYYLGVGEQLQQQGILQPTTQLAGASAGSLIAACLKSGLPISTIRDACFELAHDCRTKGTRHRLKMVLEDTLRQLLPADVAQRCSGSVHVAVTRLTPGITPQLVSHFRDRDDLIAALLTSCHIPWWFDGSLITSFRKEPCFDGGITNFLPDVPGCTSVRVCCLPSRQLGRVGGIAISPDTFNPDWPHSLQAMLGWAFEPADEEQLLQLIECGKADAAAWAATAGLTPGDAKADAGAASNGNGSNVNGNGVVLPPAGSGQQQLAQQTQQQQQQQQQPAVGRSLVLGLLGRRK